MAKSYESEVRSFDHERLAHFEPYHRLRQALNDLSNEASEHVKLGEFLDAVRDMALTAPYADTCPACRGKEPGNYLQMTWPHAVERDDGGWLDCTYRCPRCAHVWHCGYAVDVMRWI